MPEGPTFSSQPSRKDGFWKQVVGMTRQSLPIATDTNRRLVLAACNSGSGALGPEIKRRFSGHLAYTRTLDRTIAHIKAVLATLRKKPTSRH